MFVSRRSFLLSTAFIGFAVAFCGSPAYGQRQFPPSQGGSHEVWDSTIPADKVRAAFLRGRVGLPPELEKLVPGLSKEFRKQFPDIDERVAEPAIRKMLDHPSLQGFSPDFRDKIIRQAISTPEY